MQRGLIEIHSHLVTGNIIVRTLICGPVMTLYKCFYGTVAVEFDFLVKGEIWQSEMKTVLKCTWHGFDCFCNYDLVWCNICEKYKCQLWDGFQKCKLKGLINIFMLMEVIFFIEYTVIWVISFNSCVLFTSTEEKTMRTIRCWWMWTASVSATLVR